jgi:hypothetical protein
VVLTITPDKITSKTGPISFSVDYTVKTIEGKTITIEVSSPTSSEILKIEIEKNLIKIRNSRFFAGDWKKKMFGPR